MFRAVCGTPSSRVVVRRALALLGTCACAGALASSSAGAQAFRRGGGAGGFTANTLAANDDGSTGLVGMGFTVNFFGASYNQLYVNNNGNVTFGASLATFTPFNLTGSTGIPIIASYFADVDTRGAGSALTQYGIGTVDGHNAFGVNWDGVGYYSRHTDKLNIFQEILIDRSDTGAGNFDIEFNYNQMQWETGDASDGSNGFGGTSAAVGYSAGTGVAGTFSQFAGSFVNGALIDGGPNALTAGSNTSASTQMAALTPGDARLAIAAAAGVRGRYTLNVRNGQVTAPPPITGVPEPSTVALVGAGILAVAGVSRRTRRQR